jgi:hypothetical protein
VPRSDNATEPGPRQQLLAGEPGALRHGVADAGQGGQLLVLDPHRLDRHLGLAGVRGDHDGDRLAVELQLAADGDEDVLSEVADVAVVVAGDAGRVLGTMVHDY